ncbi:MAG: hypothetical protein GYB66_03765 [Chloroflexi bacterium]|nr:hypothetical protein [Chloroflexota bacterium]
MNSINLDDNTDILAEIQEEYELIQKRIRENEGLLKQSTAEVEKWEQENVRANYQWKQIDDNFDTVPRPDIRVAHDTLLEAKSRLLTMRGQLEKLQQSQEELKHYLGIFERLLQALNLDGLQLQSSGGSASTTPRATLSSAGETLIRIVQAQEDERQILAKNLHDGPAQSLTNFILQAEVCQRLFNRDPDRASVELNNLKAAASSSFQKVRDFIFDLRPMMLDDLGLIPTLRRYTESIAQKHDSLTIDFSFTGEEQAQIPQHTEVMMFRSIQMILNLGRTYLSAQNIRIQVDVGVEEVRGRIEDDGKGFDPEVDLDPTQGDTNVQSLNGLRDRIELVGGELDIYSAVDEGSRFVIRLPIFEQEPQF